MTASMTGDTAQAVFAGGCFWCMQPPFEQMPGVLATEVGYCGGHLEYPTYAQVCGGNTGHLEVIRVTYDPAQISYAGLLEVFWHNIDPTQADGQFADRGPQYQTAIFAGNAEEWRLAEASKAQLQASGKFQAPIATQIRELSPFYPAETEHQQYYRKNSLHYQLYKRGSGRAGFLEQTWGAVGEVGE